MSKYIAVCDSPTTNIFQIKVLYTVEYSEIRLCIDTVGIMKSCFSRKLTFK